MDIFDLYRLRQFFIDNLLNYVLILIRYYKLSLIVFLGQIHAYQWVGVPFEKLCEMSSSGKVVNVLRSQH